MRTVAPQNTAIGEFRPSHESPIYPYTTRLYPCQEDIMHKVNEFRNLTWKIQQPDASMVWSKVKVVLPLAIRSVDARGTPQDMRLASRLPSCNVALAETPMRAFRESTLSLNGRTFSELNFYRDTLDTCYRGHGPQQYGDNHSLKPIATRDLRVNDPDDHISVVDPATGQQQDGYSIRVSDVTEQCAAKSNSLLNSNGPFVERARLWQDNLSADGKEWRGEVTAYLELGPFANRDRESSDVPAVPYIRDFYLRLQFANQPSKYDTLLDRQSISRTVASLLLEYGLPPHILFPGDSTGWPMQGFAQDFQFIWTKKPYLEVMYTKFLGSMSTEYRLRCYERQYEQDMRFKLEPDPETKISAKVPVRIVTRLNSYPNKIYLYCEPADEYKGAYISGGCRRSCTLENIHCRINQRADVMFSPSQEECFEAFQRNTASDLDFAAWRKAPIYVFTPADLGQPDMQGNDARITWMEWTAEASLTPLQCQERLFQKHQQIMNASGYPNQLGDFNSQYQTALDDSKTIHAEMSVEGKTEYTSGLWRKGGQKVTVIDLMHEHLHEPSTQAINFATAGRELRLDDHQMTSSYNWKTLAQVDPPTECDFRPVGAPRKKLLYLDGFLWAYADPSTGAADSTLFYIPRSRPLIPFNKDRSIMYINSASLLEDTLDGAWGDGTAKHKYTIKPGAVPFQGINELDGVVMGTAAGAGINKDQHMGPAWQTDNLGIRGKDKTNGNQGPKDADGNDVVRSGNDYTSPKRITFNESTDPRRWYCFYPPASALTGDNDGRLTWRFTIDNAGDSWKATKDQLTKDTNQGASYPIERVSCKFVNLLEGQANPNENLTAQQLATGVETELESIRHRGFSLQKLNASAERFENTAWEYQLKTIYENDNAQYIFGDRAQPTKVVDNLRGV